MKDFSRLFLQLDSTTRTNSKIEHLVSYFNIADEQDKLWVVALFSHRRPRRTVNTRLLREWAAEAAGIPYWLFEDTYHVVGDLAETIAKVVPLTGHKSERRLSDWIDFLEDLRDQPDEVKKEAITRAWSSLDVNGRFLLNKLITGGFRIGVSQKTIVKALAQHLEEDESVIAHRLMGDWTPRSTSFKKLLEQADPLEDLSKPYPFYLAYALDVDPADLGDVKDWYAEYKWDGIRGQLIKRGQQVFLWSRGEELITHQFPEFDILSKAKEDFVIDGEILVYIDGKVESFNTLQKRLGRKKPSSKLVSKCPAVFMSYDIMEHAGKDIRSAAQALRREKLEALYAQLSDFHSIIKLSDLISSASWATLADKREKARHRGAEGLMLKKREGEYKTGRKKGGWYKWKVDPYTTDVVMIYAQRGHGRRANLFTDFTFAIKSDEGLVPVAKAYSGLTDGEFAEISRYVRQNTIERYGPVSSVPAELVFEIAFEAVAPSTRHKSGVALRFPRILRWRRDKKPDEINHIDDLKKLIR